MSRLGNIPEDVTREQAQLRVYVWDWFMHNRHMFDLKKFSGLDLGTELMMFCETILEGKHKEIV